MRQLAIDIETFSPVNLAQAGTYPYAADPGFELLLFAYAIDDEPVHVIDVAQGEPLPQEILVALVDPAVKKWAFNASFERVCLSSYLTTHYPQLLAEGFLDPGQWRCAMVWSAYLGLPMSLENVATVLGLDIQKDPAGKKLIKQFCTPATPNVLNNGQSRNLPTSDPEGWARFKAYNARDVEVELAIHNRLTHFPMPDAEWASYALDQRINDHGILLDCQLANNAVQIDQAHRTSLLERAKALTGLENPNSPIQLKEWLHDHGCPVASHKLSRWIQDPVVLGVSR